MEYAILAIGLAILILAIGNRTLTRDLTQIKALLMDVEVELDEIRRLMRGPNS